MPLEIIRNDITKVKADAIVNTANPEVAVGAGTDYAIYQAAGWDELLAERAKIGPMLRGQAAATPAFALDAKYIIHTVGPVWQGGDHGEREAVANCYRNSLALAKDLQCESIAFPLISTGTYGFPKDQALSTAIAEISRFLFENEMTVYMVVYDKEAFELSGKAFQGVKAYIEDSDVHRAGAFGHVSYGAPAMSGSPAMPQYGARPLENKARQAGLKERARRLFRRRREQSHAEQRPEQRREQSHADQRPEIPTRDDDLITLSGSFPEDVEYSAAMPPEDMEYTMSIDMPPDAPASAMPAEASMAMDADASLDDMMRHRDPTFQEYLFRLIDRKGMEDKDVYKRANLDRKHFSKIKSNVNYNPSKKTALALAIALGLNLDETRDLLLKAGMALTRSNTFDIIMEYCITHQIRDIYEINCILFEYDQPTLGA